MVVLGTLVATPLHAAEGGIAIQEFAPRSGPRGATLFARIAPGDSGVQTENRYDDPDMWGRRSREFDLGGIGTGVAIGDYDGDGRPDLFVVSKTESCRLFRNLGAWKFADVTAQAGVGDDGANARVWKQGATFADVNNDGLLDLYLCRFDAPNRLYVNQGDGTFQEEARAAGLDVKDASVMATFGDYDRDGWLDVFVQTNVLDAVANPEGQRDRLLHNEGNGSFTDVTDRAGVAPGPTHGNSALWWDGDEDGWPDLYVANDFAVPDAFYRNNRDGTFTDVISRTMPHAAYSSMGSDLGDVDNDGRLDVFVADMAATSHEKDQRTMAETRARLRPPAPGSGEIRQFPVNALLLATGAGRFLEAARLAGLGATDWTWSPRWEDLDEDGRVDLHVTNGMYREIHNQDLIGRRMAAESPAMQGHIMRGSPVLAETNLAWRNLGDLQFADVSTEWGLDHRGVSFGSALGDFDGDGDLDLVYANYQDGVALWRNDNAASHHAIVALRGTRSNRFGIGARVTIETAGGRQVRALETARGFMSGSEPVAHFGLGTEVRIRRLTVHWPGGTVQVFDHLPVDRRFTITEPASEPTVDAPVRLAPQFVEVGAEVGLAWTATEENFDEFIDQRLLPFGLNRRGPPLAIGDLDRTGREAIIIGGTTRQTRRVARSAGANAWKLEDSPALGGVSYVNDGPLLILDAAGRGRSDLLVTAGGTSEPAGSADYQPRLFLHDGHGGYDPAPESAVPEFPVSVGATCAADFDRDGRLDVFIGGRVIPGRYPAVPDSALWANRGGKFEDVTDRISPALRRAGMVTGALGSDVDDDGWPDLVVTLDWGEVKYFHNESGTAFADWTEKAGFAAAGSGWWRSIATADFNGDGRPDFAVGNVGLNTGYAADAHHPALLFAGDFSGRGSIDLVEAYFENDRLYPRRSRTDLGAAIPAIFRRFRTNNDYARATLPEILGADKMDGASSLAATELRSGVLLSQPDGRHRFEPWPRRVQLAPANGLAAGDFDGDGFADLFIAQNSHAPAPAIGPFDGGLGQLLRGDGRGSFTAVPPAESGLVVPGYANAVAVLDLDDDGWPDLLVARSNESTLAFRNQQRAGRHFLRVALRGTAGNPHAIGARITAEYADGATSMIEVLGGSGGFGQSTTTPFIGFTEANPLRRVHVRWPGGAITHAENLSTTGPVLRMEAPLSSASHQPD